MNQSAISRKEIFMAKYNLYVEGVSVEAIFNKLGGVEGARRFLRDELTLSEVVRSYREEDGIIRFKVTSDGTSGASWIERLEQGGYNVGDYAKQVLLSPDFKPTSGVTTEIVVMKGSLFSNNERITRNIRAEATKRKYVAPNPEVACLIRVMFTDKEIEDMGLWGIIAMHEPIKGSGGDPRLLCARRDGEGRWLHACRGRPADGWGGGRGFAFAVLAS
jgi:hypothetical protein